MTVTLNTRRDCLKTGLALLGTGFTVPAFLGRMATAIAGESLSPSQKNSRRILVVVQLAGGNDGLNTVIPFKHDVYQKSRPRLALPTDKVLKITDDYAFHPAATGMKALHEEGWLATVLGSGYPNPNRSHFVSTDIWSTASPDESMKTGVLGRFFDNECSGTAPCHPEEAVALTREHPLMLQGRQFQGVSFASPNELTWRSGNRSGRMKEAFEKLNTTKPNNPAVTELDYLNRVAMDARVSADQIKTAARGQSPVRYPAGQFARSLNYVARMVAAELPTRIYYVHLGGFDTHANQLGRHQRLMSELWNGLKAFMDDLKSTGQLDRVLVMAFSEFGRRVKENNSVGTDHGKAAPMWVLGQRIHPGFHGSYPSLDNLDQGDLGFAVDFRRVYADILTNWLKANSTELLGGHFEPLKVVKA